MKEFKPHLPPVVINETSEELEVTQIQKSASFLNDSQEITLKRTPFSATPTSTKTTPHESRTTNKTDFDPALKRKALIITLPFASLLFILTLYFFEVWIPDHTQTTSSAASLKTSDLKNPLPLELFGPQDHNIQLSDLTIAGFDPLSVAPPVVRPTQNLSFSFYLEDWQTPPQKELNFKVALKIFQNNGKLVYQNNELDAFHQLADAKTETIEVGTQLKILPGTPEGLYRIHFDVIDESSNKEKNLQTMFRVLNK